MIDQEKKWVKSSVWGIHKKIAIYREGFGCTLINPADTSRLLGQKLPELSIKYAADTWPKSQVIGESDLAEALKKAFDKPGERKMNTRAILVIKNGEILAEAYADGITKDTPLLGWSMSKSVTATLVGILVKKGFWNLDSHIPIKAWQEDERSNIKLGNLLNANSGLQWDEDYGDVTNTTTMLYHESDFGQYAASFPAADAPTQNFKYSSGTTNILAKAMRDAFKTDQAYWTFPHKQLFGPIGASSFVLELDPSGNFAGSSYTYANARDWGKLGLLYLNQGNWNGQQIIDSTWVDFVQTTSQSSQGEYGGQFWLNRGGKFAKYDASAYWMGGYQGQQVSIHPEKDMVIVRLGVTYNRNDFDFSEIIGRIIEVAEMETERQ